MITIKNASQLAKMRSAGHLLYDVLCALREKIVPGITTKDIDAWAEELIRRAGAIPSFLNYQGFPACVCTSVDSQVVHGIPSADVRLNEGSILSVDCGLILDGKLYEGADGAAGEFGHTIIMPEGRLCTCGARGCLEMYCSGKSLAQQACSLYGPRELFTLGARFAGAELLIKQARSGDAQATEVLERSFSYLGIGLANLVNMLNPRLIVLGGSIVFGWPQGADIAREVVMRTALPGARHNLRIEISKLRHFAGVLGGAALVSSYGRW